MVKSSDNSAVLSIGVGFESNAQLAAIYGMKILLGEISAGKLKVGVVTPPDIAISFKRVEEIGMKIPYDFFESAAFIYDYNGVPVRVNGQNVK